MIRGQTQYNPLSRFVKEIPSNLMDNKMPERRRYEDDFDSYERPTRNNWEMPDTGVTNRWQMVTAGKPTGNNWETELLY